LETAIRTGIFCAIVAGICFLLSGLMGRALSLDPLVSFSMMAGVLTPMVMVFSGMLARWAGHRPYSESLPDSPLMASLASGLTTAALSAIIFISILTLSENAVFPGIGLLGLDMPALPGVAALFAAYVAMAVIGGELYGLIFRGALHS